MLSIDEDEHVYKFVTAKLGFTPMLELRYACACECVTHVFVCVFVCVCVCVCVCVAEEGGSTLSTVKMNYADFVHLTSSKLCGSVTKVMPLWLFSLVSMWLAGFKITMHKSVLYRSHKETKCFYRSKCIFLFFILSTI